MKVPVERGMPNRGPRWPAKVSAVSPNGRQEFTHIDTQGPREPTDIVDRHVALSPFHRSYVGSVDSCFIGECLLREAVLRSQSPQIRRHECPTIDGPLKMMSSSLS